MLYARVPRSGRVKTRMTPWLSVREALGLHLALVEDSLGLLRACARRCGALPIVSWSEPWDPSARPGRARIARVAAGLARQAQRGTDLGERLERTFRTLISRGFGRVVVIGSDSPTLPPATIQSAFDALVTGADVVLGPAEDGGYCLVGAVCLVPQMFEGIPWGTGRVMGATRAALESCGARLAVLPPWYDVDRPRDLERARLDLSRRPADDPAPVRTRAFIGRLVRDGRLPFPAPTPAAARPRRSRSRSGTRPGTSGRIVFPR